MLIIAEAGINHNGDYQKAKELVDVAVWAGADVVKFQTFWNIERLKDYELTKKQFYYLKKYCDTKGIEFMSTPHTFEAIHFLDKLVQKYKIASTHLTNPNFLMEVSNKSKPILLSTGSLIHENGMATDEEILHALSYIPHAKVELLHCVSRYPCTNSHLERMNELDKLERTPRRSIGLSDHTKNIDMPNVSILEKHLMIDKDCIDSNVSLNPDEFKEMVRNLRE